MTDRIDTAALRRAYAEAEQMNWVLDRQGIIHSRSRDAVVVAINFFTLAHREWPALLDRIDALEGENARLREVNSEPVNLCEMPEVAAMRYIETLRADEGDSVSILCDDPEAMSTDNRLAVECVGDWTGWKPQRFYGESVLQCLARAVAARTALGDPS